MDDPDATSWAQVPPTRNHYSLMKSLFINIVRRLAGQRDQQSVHVLRRFLQSSMRFCWWAENTPSPSLCRLWIVTSSPRRSAHSPNNNLRPSMLAMGCVPKHTKDFGRCRIAIMRLFGWGFSVPERYWKSSNAATKHLLRSHARCLT